MSKETGVIILGIIVVILPFLGFPEDWRVVGFILCGGAIAVLGFMLRNREPSSGMRAANLSSFPKTFVQNEAPNPIHEHETEPPLSPEQTG